MKCRNCGHKFPEDTQICPNCGSVFEVKSETLSISRTLAVGGIILSLLSLFLPFIYETHTLSTAMNDIPITLTRRLLKGPQLEGIMILIFLICGTVLMALERRIRAWECLVLGGVVIGLDVLAVVHLMDVVEFPYMWAISTSLGFGCYLLLAGGVMLVAAGVLRWLMHR